MRRAAKERILWPWAVLLALLVAVVATLPAAASIPRELPSWLTDDPLPDVPTPPPETASEPARFTLYEVAVWAEGRWRLPQRAAVAEAYAKTRVWGLETLCLAQSQENKRLKARIAEGVCDGPSQYIFAGYDPINMGDPLGLYVGYMTPEEAEAAVGVGERRPAVPREQLNEGFKLFPYFEPGITQQTYEAFQQRLSQPGLTFWQRLDASLGASIYMPFAVLEEMGRGTLNTPHDTLEARRAEWAQIQRHGELLRSGLDWNAAEEVLLAEGYGPPPQAIGMTPIFGGSVRVPGNRPSGSSFRPRGKAPEFPGGQTSESGFIDSVLDYLGPGYREVSAGRYVSADGLRQVRFGAHEVRGPHLHGHFEAFDAPYGKGGRVVENTLVRITSD